MTKAFPCCIFAVKQNINIMKTKSIVTIMVFSGLCIIKPFGSTAQEQLILAHSADLCAEMPALSCFMPSYAGICLRNDFGKKELMNAELFGVLSLGKNYLISYVNHYGYANYGNLHVSVGYGRNFGEHFAMSGHLIYMMNHARGYPASHSLCADFAFVGRISPKLFLLTTIHNPFMMRYGIVGQNIIPLKFTIGCMYVPLRKLLISVTTAKTLPGAWEVNCRFMTLPVPPLLVAIDCSNFHLGAWIGLSYKNFLFSVKAAWYYRISVSPEVGGYYFDH